MVTLDRIREGDVEALEELLQEAWAPLVRHLIGLLGSPEAAQDAAQEAFVRLWERRERWESGSARALVFRIGRNAALDQTRRRRVRERWVGREGTGMPAAAPAPDEDLARADVRRRVDAALAVLPQRRREVFELVRFEGLSYREVADATELSVQTVANHMSLALRDLREALADLVAPSLPAEPEARSHDG